MFWNSDYMSHQRPGYLACIKTVSTRTVGSESGNGEGLKNYHLAMGTMCLMKTGREYDRIYPLWNWRMLPGLTCAQSEAPFPEIPWGEGSRGTTLFAGGVSDGTYGASAFDFNRDGVQARKGWFCFDGEIVCLGAGIQSESKDEVITTIEQNWRTGEVSAGTGGASSPVVPDQTTDLKNDRWLLHGTTGYFFPEAQQAWVRTQPRKGSWYDINQSYPMTQSGEVFAAWIDHGLTPRDAAYAYVVLPNTDATQLAAYVPPQILANTPQLQAVWHDRLKILEAVFLRTGENRAHCRRWLRLGG